MDEYTWRKDTDKPVTDDAPTRWITRHNDRRLVVSEEDRDLINQGKINPDVFFLDLNSSYIEIEKLADNASLALLIDGPTINYLRLQVVTYIPHTRQITGTVTLRLNDAISIEELYVLPVFRRRRYGSMLLRIATQVFNCHLLECEMDNTDAQTFYVTNHWRNIGTTVRNTYIMFHE